MTRARRTFVQDLCLQVGRRMPPNTSVGRFVSIPVFMEGFCYVVTVSGLGGGGESASIETAPSAVVHTPRADGIR
jgi:hypothetical protein